MCIRTNSVICINNLFNLLYCMYVCINTYVRTYIHTYVHSVAKLFTKLFTYVCTYVRTYGTYMSFNLLEKEVNSQNTLVKNVSLDITSTS